MTNEKIKESLEGLVGKKIVAKVDIGRNKFEYIDGIILKTYPFLFTIQTKSEIKSFSYSDILTKKIIIKPN